jgi:predicted nicotinamide N-methyase
MLTVGKIEAEKYLITSQFYDVLLLGDVFYNCL